MIEKSLSQHQTYLVSSHLRMISCELLGVIIQFGELLRMIIYKYTDFMVFLVFIVRLCQSRQEADKRLKSGKAQLKLGESGLLQWHLAFTQYMWWKNLAGNIILQQAKGYLRHLNFCEKNVRYCTQR